MSPARHKHAAIFAAAGLPFALLLLLSMGVVQQLGLLKRVPADAALYVPETVLIAPRTFRYRANGEFVRGVHSIDPPLETVRETRPLTIMKYQVAAADYEMCVAESACSPAAQNGATNGDLPVTGVSFDDASAYARWLSVKSGQRWILPSDRQIAFAAGERFPDDASGLDPDNKNPALKWIADYEREAASRSSRDAVPRAAGGFGENQYGLADFAGNIWEWTSTCHRRVILTDGRQRSVEEICGIRVAVGPHRSPTSSFIRDPKGGGCSVGTPPDNLGFRLVRAVSWYALW
jgi:formylglycine-generating enzyme required for sulfatase activity